MDEIKVTKMCSIVSKAAYTHLCDIDSIDLFAVVFTNLLFYDIFNFEYHIIYKSIFTYTLK